MDAVENERCPDEPICRYRTSQNRERNNPQYDEPHVSQGGCQTSLQPAEHTREQHHDDWRQRGDSDDAWYLLSVGTGSHNRKWQRA